MTRERARELRGIRIELRKAILERDDYTCQDCGVKGKSGKGGRDVQVHHITPYRDGGDNSADNLITLCVVCYRKHDREVMAESRRYRQLNPPTIGDIETAELTIPDYLTRKEAAALLDISIQRISQIAIRDKWLKYQVGRSHLYDAQDVARTAERMQAQKAWAKLGIPRRHWSAWWLADMDEVDSFDCPACSGAAYSPAGDTKWSEMAACSECDWQK